MHLRTSPSSSICTSCTDSIIHTPAEELPPASQSIPRFSSKDLLERLKATCSRSSVQLQMEGEQIKNTPLNTDQLPSIPPSSYNSRRCSRSSSFVSRTSTYDLDPPTTYINAISFDGGGVRGASSAKIVNIIMDDLANATGTEPHPADYFDMFGGTSTGGLIAMMLGRLRISTKTLLATYSDLSNKLFKSKIKLFRSVFQGCKYSGKLAERLFAKIVADHSAEGANATLRNTEFGAPDVFVAAVNARDGSGDPLIIRSYDVGDESDSVYAHRIADAARATTAAPAYFPAKILVNGQVALDGGLAVNNPTDVLISEARRKYGRGVRFGLLLSIGTGEKAPVAIPACSSAASIISLTRAIGHIVTDSEKTHLRVEDRFRDSDLGTYLRINVPSIGDVTLDDYKSIPMIISETEKYMSTPEMVEIRKQVAGVLLRSRCDSFHSL